MSKIYVFEGWLTGNDSYVSRMLREIGVKNFSGHAYNERVPHPGKPCVWIGLSLGGHAALNHAKPGDLCICLDPRWMNAASYFDFLIPFQKPFTAPKGVKVYCFYRHGFLPGYPVVGGENHKLPITVSHPGVPKYVSGEVKKILEDR